MSRIHPWVLAALSLATATLVSASPALAAGGDVFRRGNPEWRLRLGGSGEDRFIAEVRADAYGRRPDGLAVICGVRVTELTSGTIPPPGAIGCELRLEDPANPGYPDLSQAGLFALADPESMGACSGPFYYRRVFTFGRGAGVSDPRTNHYMCAIEPLQGTGAGDFCSVLMDPATYQPEYWGASKVYSGGAFETLQPNWTLLIEAVVYLPQDMDLTLRAHGSARFPGDHGIPAVFTNRPNPARSITDDNISLTLSIDNDTGGPLARNVTICADESVIDPKKGPRVITSFFRPVGGGDAIANPLLLPFGRTVLRFEVAAVSLKRKAAAVVSKRVIDLRLRVLVDDPALDTDACMLDGAFYIDDETQQLGLRRRAGSADDDSVEAFFTVQSPNQAGDSLNVRFQAIDMPKVAYDVTGFEVVGGEFGGSGLPGLDAIELRTEDPIITGSPDLSNLGLLRSFGSADGVGSAPLGPIPTTAVFDCMDIRIDPSLDPSLGGNIFVLGLLLPGESEPTTAIGADEYPLDTILGDSSFTVSGLQPASQLLNNLAIRVLLDGDRATLEGAAPPATVSPYAMLRRVDEFIAIDFKTGRRIE